MSRDGQQDAASRRVLIVKLGAIGDVLMAIPAARVLHDAGYSIDWVCGRAVVPLLSLYPWIRLFQVDDGALLRGGMTERIGAVLSAWSLVSRQHYELCATLYYDRRYSLLAAPVRARRKLRLSFTERERMLLPGRHHTDEYARVIAGPLGLWPDSERREPLGPVAPQRGHCQDDYTDRDRRSRRIALCPGGARNPLRDDPQRRWPTDRYVALAGELIARGFEVTLIGGPDDAWVVAAFAGLSVDSRIGKHSLVETLDVLAHHAVLVTHDTGPLHLAGLIDIGIVAVFGPTDPSTRIPRRAGSTAIWGGDGYACRPCYDGRAFAPCATAGCIASVTPKQVLERVVELARRGGGAGITVESGNTPWV